MNIIPPEGQASAAVNASPTVLAHIPREELERLLLLNYGWVPLFVEGHESTPLHRKIIAAQYGDRADSPVPAQRTRRRGRPAAALTDDRAQMGQGLDQPEASGNP